MNKNLLNIDIQSFIVQKLNEDPVKTVLKGSPFPEVKIKEIVEQIISKKKSKKKLPTWFNTDGIYYPNKINIEQTSSEITAKYKSKLTSGSSLIDITGGFGVDCFYLAKQLNFVTHCEINSDLSEIAANNFKKLQVNNIKTISGDGLFLLKNIKHKFDWIYADPSRRDNFKGKVFLLNDCLPNIPENLNFLFQYSDNILLKISPLLDITSTIKELDFVKEIHVIAVSNDVKELLFLLKKHSKKEIKIKTVNIKKENVETFDSILKSNVIPSYSLPKNYLYEPNKAILKAGLFNEISKNFKLDKLHSNSHLYTSNDLINFPGRRFKINQISSYDRKQLRKIIPNKQANITTRNFPQTVAQIRKKIGLREGGDNYLFFTRDINNNHIVLICEKLVE